MEYVTGSVDDDLDADEDVQQEEGLDVGIQQTMSWPDFDDIVQPKAWTLALIANPQLWAPLCVSWEAQLRDAYQGREVSSRRRLLTSLIELVTSIIRSVSDC
jgi:hypothetical protein